MSLKMVCAFSGHQQATEGSTHILYTFPEQLMVDNLVLKMIDHLLAVTI